MAIQDIFNAIIRFEEDSIADLVRKEIDAGTAVDAILNEGLIGAMDEVGKRFGEGELFVPEMLQAAQIMKAGLEVVKPLLAQGDTQSRGTVVIGTVKGDLHDIGKNLVAMMMEGAGFDVVDLGVDVDSEKFIAAAVENQADVVCMSALLTTTMPVMAETVKAIADQGLAYKTMIGGAPVTQAFANKIGASGFGEDAPSAVELVRRLIAV